MGTSATDLLERHRGGDILPAGRAFGAEVVPVPVSTGPHSHDFCELAIVLAGSGRHGTRHDDVVVARGDAVGVRPCDWHQWHEPVGLTVANVYVDQALLRTGVAPVATNPVLRMFAWPVPALPAPGIARLAAGDLHRVEDAVAALASAGAPDADASRRGADDIADLGHLLVILGIVAAALPVHAAGRAAAAPVDAVRILEEDLAAPWTVAALARAVGLSPGHLSRQFRLGFGAAPMRVLSGLRANRAAAALIATDLPVAAVGRRVGWSDPNYFSRRFRSEYQVSPTEYRERFR